MSPDGRKVARGGEKGPQAGALFEAGDREPSRCQWLLRRAVLKPRPDHAKLGDQATNLRDRCNQVSPVALTEPHCAVEVGHASGKNVEGDGQRSRGRVNPVVSMRTVDDRRGKVARGGGKVGLV